MEALCDLASPLQSLFSTGWCCNVNESSFKMMFYYPLRFVRTKFACSQRLFICRARFADSGIEGSLNLKLVSPALLAAEKEEAKAVLMMFLKKQGLSHTVAARAINKSELFIDHLVDRLHSAHKSRYLVGRELTALEIESLLEEHGIYMVDVVESFPDAPVKTKTVAPVIKSQSSVDLKKLKAISRVSEIGPAGKLPPHIQYLLELGMDLDQLKGIARRFPSMAYYSLEGKIKPTVEFLLDLGVPKSDIPTILFKRPQLCGISLYENIMPTMRFLENLGVDKKQWATEDC